MGEMLTSEELKNRVSDLQSEGKKVVFTNGCFDIIHIGHVRYLKEAKKLGDTLIVAVNSDKSVSRIKPGRPINTESHRAEVLLALNMVDFVTIFDTDTPYELIKFLMPDVLVKGGDWKLSDIVGSDLVKDTRSIPYIENISTTNIIRKIEQSK